MGHKKKAKSESGTPKQKVVRVHVVQSNPELTNDPYAFTPHPVNKAAARISPSDQKFLTTVLSRVKACVRIIDPIVAEVIRTGSSDLGAFPLSDLTPGALAAFYIAILAERDMIAHGQVIWPVIEDEDDFDKIDEFGWEYDFGAAVEHYLWPRVYGNAVPTPFEFLPNLPTGMLLGLCARRCPVSTAKPTKGKAKPTIHLECYWDASTSGLFTAPKSAQQAVAIVERYLGSFNPEIQSTAVEENVCDLTEVEVFPQVTPFGLAALWLAALRHEEFVIAARPKWPPLFAEDLLYLATFGDEYTKYLVKTYLDPLPKESSERTE